MHLFHQTVEGFASLLFHRSRTSITNFVFPLLLLEKNFQKMMDSMLANPDWTLRPWKQIMEDQLSSWLMYIPGMSNSKDVAELKGLKGT